MRSLNSPVLLVVLAVALIFAFANLFFRMHQMDKARKAVRPSRCARTDEEAAGAQSQSGYTGEPAGIAPAVLTRRGGMTTEFIRQRRRELAAWRASRASTEPLTRRVTVLAMLAWGGGMMWGAHHFWLGLLMIGFAVVVWFEVTAKIARKGAPQLTDTSAAKHD